MQTSRDNTGWHREAGAGLMEVIVGALCTLIVAFVIVQVIRIGYSKATLRWQTESIASELANAKSQAQARGQNVTVFFEARHHRYGIDRNGNGILDNNEAEDLPEDISLTEDAAVTFTKTGVLAPKSKEPEINVSNARDSHKVTVSSAGIIDVE